jgi:CheY-specific phosphatase CheX
MMNVLEGKALMRLREEYAAAVVENMSQQEAFAYLRQVIYNDVAVANGEELGNKIIRIFGQEMYDAMVADITTPKVRSTAAV